MEKGKGKFKCAPCGKSYTTKEGLKYHHKQPYCEFYQPPKDNDGNIIPHQNKYKCDPCGKSYTTKEGLKYHQNQPSCKLYKPLKHDNGNITRTSEKPKFTCDPCGKSYARNYRLLCHQREPSCKLYNPTKDEKGNIISTSERPKFTCDPCGKSYTRNDSLLHHQRQPSCKLYKPAKDKDGNIIRNSEKPKFTCDPCGKSYTRNYRLLYHQREPSCKLYNPTKDEKGNIISTSEKPRFTCDPCGKSYTRNDTLLYHQSRPYCKLYKPAKDKDGNIIPNQGFRCEKCDATFESKLSLNRHLKKHLIPKKDAGFQNKKRIYTITTSEERADLKCVPCKLKFKTRSNLYQHKKENRCNKIKLGFICGQNKPSCKLYGPPKDEKVNLIRTSEKPSFTCEPCGKSYTRNDKLQYHQSRPYCKLYQPLKNDDGNIIQQLPKYACDICGQLLSCARGSEKSSFPSPDPQEFICGKCHKVFKLEELSQTTDEQDCKRRLKNQQNHLEFMKLTTEEERLHLKCLTCNKSFSRQECLREHKLGYKCNPNRSLIKPPAFKCQRCLKRFFSEQGYNYHTRKGFCSIRLIIHGFVKPEESFKNRDQISIESNSDHDDLKIQFFCWWCCDHFSSQAEMVQHMETVHDKEIATEKLKIADEETLKIDPAKPRIHCCYICLRKYPSVTPTVLCIRACERDIGVSMEGFVPLRDRKLGWMLGKQV